jgi:hypothetical protein
MPIGIGLSTAGPVARREWWDSPPSMSRTPLRAREAAGSGRTTVSPSLPSYTADPADCLVATHFLFVAGTSGGKVESPRCRSIRIKALAGVA